MSSEDHAQCCTKCREEFRCSCFGLEYKYPSHFVTTQCGRALIYPIWTVFRLLYHSIWIIVMIVLDYYDDMLPRSDWHIFLTNWTYTIINIHIFWDFCVTVYTHFSKSNILKENSSKMPWYLKLNWVLFNVKNSLGFMVSVGYYCLFGSEGTIENDAASVEKHALILVFLLMDFFLCAKPVRLLHCYQTIPVLVLYGLFSYLYQRSGNDPIYPVLDWYDPSVAIVAVVVILGIPFVHWIFYALYHLRLYMSRCGGRKVESSYHSEMY